MGSMRFSACYYYDRKGIPISKQLLNQRCIMSTDRQIEANRLNAQHSSGPSTPEGRAAVRLNGLKYGLYAETLILPREDPADFETLLDRLHAQHPPTTPTEALFVSPMATASRRTAPE